MKKLLCAAALVQPLMASNSVVAMILNSPKKVITEADAKTRKPKKSIQNESKAWEN